MLGAGLLLVGLLSSPARADNEPAFEISNLELAGNIVEENVTFTLSFVVDAHKSGVRVPLVRGDVAYTQGRLPGRTKLVREGDSYVLEVQRRGSRKVEFQFAARAAKDGDWREAQFSIPGATVRRLSMLCDRDDLEVRFPGALSVERRTEDLGTVVSAYLGVGDGFHVRWKPEVRKLAADVAVACDANTVAVASVGAMRMDTVFTYRVVQGALDRLRLLIPENVNVIDVDGADILEWTITETTPGARTLEVSLNQPHEEAYRLRVETETVLPAFPTSLSVPLVRPDNVMRTSGFLQVGTDSAIRLVVNKATGLTQVDQDAFPQVRLADHAERLQPQRAIFAYQYANMPYTLDLAVDDIVTTFNCEEQFVLSLSDRDVTVIAAVELDVRDAPARDILIRTDPAWTVAQVEGAHIADHDVTEQKGERLIAVYFREAVLGRTRVQVRLERTLGDDETAFAAPLFSVKEAKTERGYIVLSAEKGVRLKPTETTELRRVPTGSLPVRVARAQEAYRFKSSAWSLGLELEVTAPTIYAETFHLVSLGEGALYGSASITYHVAGAPVRNLELSIPDAYQNVEFVGCGIRNWSKEDDRYVVSLQEKVLGDYTLLVTYDQQFPFEGGDILVGAITPVRTASEVGYIALAGAASMRIEDATGVGQSVLPVDVSEVPKSYTLLINDPVIQAYKYVQTPHTAVVKLRRSPTTPLLAQVADHATLDTTFSADGELVTTAVYYVKNASEQYLGVTLPERAQLWTARVDGEAVPILHAAGEGDPVLVPLKRHRDPDRPSRVELVYAESVGKPAFWKRIHLRAPTVAAQAVFSKWTLSGPEDRALAVVGGNMAQERPLPALGPGRFGRQLLSALRVWLGGGYRTWLVLASLVAVGLLLFAAGSGRFVSWWSLAGLTAVVAAIGLARVVIGASAPAWSCGVLQPAEPHSVSVTRVVNLPDATLDVVLRVLPPWLGAASSPWLLMLLCAAGLLVVGVAYLRHAPGWVAAGLTLFTCGLTYGAATLHVAITAMAWSGTLAAVVAVGWACCRLGLRHPRAGRTAEEAPPMVPAALGGGDPQSGSARLALPVVLLALQCAVAGAWAAGVAVGQGAESAAPEYRAPQVGNLEVTVEAPAAEDRDTRVARVRMVFSFEVERPETFRLPSGGRVLAAYELGSRHLALRNEGQAYVLDVERGGEYRVVLDYLAPVTDRDGVTSVELDLPANLQNKVVVRNEEQGLDVTSPAAVLVTSEEKDGGTETTLVFGAARNVAITWRPRLRRTALEEAVFFCEMNTLAAFNAGVATMTHSIRYQVAQGEVQALRLSIPEGTSVTAVIADTLSTWRYDPATQSLEALLARPVSEDFTLTVVTQAPREGLPYDVGVEVPAVVGAARHRGSLAVAAPERVQVRVVDTEGLNAMNIDDFSPEALRAATRSGNVPVVKRAFRYHQVPVQATVAAESVQPEVRVQEQASLDISDERIVLSTKLTLAIARSGVFSVNLLVPDGYDVESLTGQDVSHWDEVTEGGRRAVVHFARQALGDRTLSLVLARMERGLGKAVTVPRVQVEHARKHTGTLVVSGERGVYLRPVEREGVSELNPVELGIQNQGYLAFRLLRPDWSLTMGTEVREAMVKADVLQKVALSRGMMVGQGYIRYRIEGAGVKSFDLLAPAPGMAITVHGENIAQVRELDKETGLWRVELHDKVQKQYRLDVSYQLQGDTGAEVVRIHPLKTVDTEGQKGYLAVMADERLEVTPEAAAPGLKVEDARTIPRGFGAGDLANAILCYRTTRPDYWLDVKVLRHDSARLLPAEVKAVDLTSVVSEDDHMVTRALVQLRVGELRFLRSELPRNGQVWSLLINGKATKPLLDGDTLLIPLDGTSATDLTAVELIYGGQAERGWWGGERTVAGPRFDLPLSAVQWTFYLPSGHRYRATGGTLQPRTVPEDHGVTLYDATRYRAMATQHERASLRLAEDVLRKGEAFAQQGRQREAKQAFEAAVNYSVGQEDFNEDARIQYRNLARRQAIVGLVTRRDNLKRNWNVQAEAPPGPSVEEGEWTPDYGLQVEQSLSSKDNDSLSIVADRMLDQQAAAEGAAPAIRVTMPLQGRRMLFERALQIRPLADMTVVYKRTGADRAGWLMAAGVLAALLLFYRSLFCRVRS